MAEARVLTDLTREALDLKRRRLGVGEQLGTGHLQLNLTSRQLGVDRLLGAAHHRADRGQHVLGAELVGKLEQIGARSVGVEDELDQPRPVAQVDEDQPAVVAAAVDPTGDPHLGVDSIAQHLAAPDVAIAVGAQHRRLAHDSPPVSSSINFAVSTRRCSPEAMSRSCAEPSASRISTRRAPTRSACLS